MNELIKNYKKLNVTGILKEIRKQISGLELISDVLNKKNNSMSMKTLIKLADASADESKKINDTLEKLKDKLDSFLEENKNGTN